MSLPRPLIPAALAAGLLLAPLSVPAAAQSVRGSSTTSFRYLQVRPLVEDTVDRSRVDEGPDGRLRFDGVPVTCGSSGVCTFLHSPATEDASTAVQDLRLTGWGFGVEGLSARAHLRAREDLGGDFVWPRSDDPFDLVTGYLQYNRGDVRLRLGRQRSRSGLGFDSFDGLDVLYEPERWLHAEVFGGRSLARGLHETRSEALRGVEDFLLDRDAYLLGGSAGIRAAGHTEVTARYQREIWSGRAALVSERASLDLRTGALDPVDLTASLDYDFAMGRVGKGSVSARVPLRDEGIHVTVTGRRYVPYFELWTIWGLFDPAAYHEGAVRTSWAATDALEVWGGAAYRSYDDTDTSPLLGPLEDDAYRLEGGARWRADPRLALTGEYRMERGAGAFLSSGEVSAEWRPLERLRLRLHGLAAQQIEEFRVGEGMVGGGGLTGDYRLGDRVRVSGGAAVYRRFFENRPGAVDWNQVRAWSSVRLTVGGDPGLPRGGSDE